MADATKNIGPAALSEIAGALRSRLELLLASGIRELPVEKAVAAAPAPGVLSCDSSARTFEGTLAQARSFSACDQHGWKGVAFGVWLIGRVAVIWSVPASTITIQDGPFAKADEDQLGRMMKWLSGELKAQEGGFRLFVSGSCENAPSDYAGDAARCAPLITQWLGKNQRAALLMGALATSAFISVADIKAARGRVHTGEGGIKLVASFPPDEVLRDPDAKKEAFSDLKLLIKAATC